MTDKVNAQDIAYAVAQTLNGFSTQSIECADVVYPQAGAPGNPAVVITARDGSRYGLEVCPILAILPETPRGEPVSSDEAPANPTANWTSYPWPVAPTSLTPPKSDEPEDCGEPDPANSCGVCPSCKDAIQDWKETR